MEENKNWYKRVGYPTENRLLKRLQKEGWLCYRTAGSRGERAVDLIAIKRDPITNQVIIRFIQAKATKDERKFEKPLRCLSKKEKEELRYLCELFKDYDNIRVELFVKKRYSRDKKFVDLKKDLL